MLYDDRVAHLLTEALRGATSLTDVVLSGNPFSEGAAIGMADVMLANSAIEVLNDVPVRQLRADAIEELDLSLKRIGIEGAFALAALLPDTRKLQSLSVAFNAGDSPIVGIGAERLATAVLSTHTITTFSNGLDLSALRANRLRTLQMMKGGLGVTECVLISKLLLANRKSLVTLECAPAIRGPLVGPCDEAPRAAGPQVASRPRDPAHLHCTVQRAAERLQRTCDRQPVAVSASLNDNEVGIEGLKALAKAIAVSESLEDVL